MPRGLLIALAPPLFATSVGMAQPSIQNLGVLDGMQRSSATDLSANGAVVVGTSSRSDEFGNLTAYAFRWTAASGMTNLGVLSWNSYGFGVSADGSTVVGNSGTPTHERAFQWRLGSMYQVGGSFSTAYAASGNGHIVVGGRHPVGPDPYGPFRWTAATGPVYLRPGIQGAAAGIDEAGTVIAGWSGSRACIWTSEGFQDLGVLPGTGTSSALHVSADGSTVIGVSGSRGFRWTQDLGMQSLSGTVSATPNAVNADGSIIVGASGLGAFYWTADTGIISLQSYLTSLGADLTGWSLTSATGISSDGTVLAGSGRYEGQSRAWLVVIPSPSAASVLILGTLAAFRRRRT